MPFHHDTSMLYKKLRKGELGFTFHFLYLGLILRNEEVLGLSYFTKEVGNQEWSKRKYVMRKNY